MHWMKEVEIAKSIADLMTSQSITGRPDFPDCDMLDAMIASALKRVRDKHVHFRKYVSVEGSGTRTLRFVQKTFTE